MKLIVGLGNPGAKYEKTRHNLGFMVLDHFLKDIESVEKSNWSKEEKLKSLIYLLDYKPKAGPLERVILAKPLTYMNNSGMAVSLLARFYKVAPEDIWIIHDEIDLPLGMMKIRQGGSAAGHHGVESIIKALGSDKFFRFRLGIGHSKTRDQVAKTRFGSMTEFVLRGFKGQESSKARSLAKRAVKAIETALEEDLDRAMNQFNTK